MWIQPMFVDGVGTSSSTMRDGVTMIGVDRDSWRPAGEVVGWRIACDCEFDVESLNPTRIRWVSSVRWVRVPSTSLEDVAVGQIFAADDETPDLESREDVAAAARSLWQREHLRLVDVDDEIVLALAAHRSAATAIDVAVARARRAGRTWDHIGRTAGMSAPGANSRWKERIAGDDTHHLVDELDAMIDELDGRIVTAAERVGLSTMYLLAGRRSEDPRPSVADVLDTYGRAAPKTGE